MPLGGGIYYLRPVKVESRVIAAERMQGFDQAVKDAAGFTGIKRDQPWQSEIEIAEDRHHLPLLRALPTINLPQDGSNLRIVTFEPKQLDYEPPKPHSTINISIHAIGVFDSDSGVPRAIVGRLLPQSNLNSWSLDPALGRRDRFYGRPQEMPPISFLRAVEIVGTSADLSQAEEILGMYVLGRESLLKQNADLVPCWWIAFGGVNAHLNARIPREADRNNTTRMYCVNAATGAIISKGWLTPFAGKP